MKFYEIREQFDRFLLQKRKLDTDELLAYFPWRNRSFDHKFDDLEQLRLVKARSSRDFRRALFLSTSCQRHPPARVMAGLPGVRGR
ncbi:hypothetical protein [Rhizobium leguminosarum]